MESMSDLSKIPVDAVGLRLCKMRGENLILCEPIVFEHGRVAIDTILRRAKVSGKIGPIGETGDYWADFINSNGDWEETIALSREAWNGLKNHWMRCRHETYE